MIRLGQTVGWAIYSCVLLIPDVEHNSCGTLINTNKVGSGMDPLPVWDTLPSGLNYLTFRARQVLGSIAHQTRIQYSVMMSSTQLEKSWNMNSAKNITRVYFVLDEHNSN